MNQPPMDTPLATRFECSPNHGERRAGARIAAIILHYTGLRDDALDQWCADPGGESLRWLCAAESQVSSHYLIQLNGEIVQLVPEARRAWHAGAGSWKDWRDLNSWSIGIEIVNTGHSGGLPAYPDAQIDSVINLCADIAARHSIASELILAHSDIAPARKADPGEHFPWERLHRAGIGHWIAPVALRDGPALGPGDSGAEVAALQRQLSAYGYGIEASGLYDTATMHTVRAFQRHFRAGLVDGLADVSTRDTLAALIAALPSYSAATA